MMKYASYFYSSSSHHQPVSIHCRMKAFPVSILLYFLLFCSYKLDDIISQPTLWSLLWYYFFVSDTELQLSICHHLFWQGVLPNSILTSFLQISSVILVCYLTHLFRFLSLEINSIMYLFMLLWVV